MHTNQLDDEPATGRIADSSLLRSAPSATLWTTVDLPSFQAHVTSWAVLATWPITRRWGIVCFGSRESATDWRSTPDILSFVSTLFSVRTAGSPSPMLRRTKYEDLPTSSEDLPTSTGT